MTSKYSNTFHCFTRERFFEKSLFPTHHKRKSKFSVGIKLKNARTGPFLIQYICWSRFRTFKMPFSKHLAQTAVRAEASLLQLSGKFDYSFVPTLQYLSASAPQGRTPGRGSRAAVEQGARRQRVCVWVRECTRAPAPFPTPTPILFLPWKPRETWR